MASSDFQYLSYLILFVLLIYLFILFAFLVIRRSEIKARLRDRPPLVSHGFDDASFTFDFTTRVEEAGSSVFGRKTRYLLALLRGGGCLFCFVYGIVIAGNESSQTFNYFDGWNMLLFFVYFLCSFVVTLAVIWYYPHRQSEEVIVASPQWSYALRCVAVAAHLMFEVAGGSALLILFGEIVNIQSVGTLSDANIAVFVILTVDLIFNCFNVRFDQFPACAAWLMTYLLIVWPSVFTGSLRSWPYAFLSTSSSVCFGTYLALFIASFFCYLTWYAIFRTKQRVMGFFYRGKNPLRREYESREMVDLVDMHTRINAQTRLNRGGENAESFYSLPDDLADGDDDHTPETENTSGTRARPARRTAEVIRDSDRGLLPPPPVQRRFSSFNDTDANIMAYGGF